MAPSLLISWGGPCGQPGFLTRDSLASAAVQVGLCLSPPSLNEQTLPFYRGHLKAPLSQSRRGEWLSIIFIFSNQGDTSASCGASALSCSVLSGYTAPFLRLREQSLFHRQWNPYDESPPLLKSEILPLFLLLTTGRLTFCPGNFQHSQYEQTQQHSLNVQ